MKTIRIILFFSLLLASQITFGQGFSYTFEDPCTFKSKTIYVNNPSGNVFLTYNGQVRSFTPQQLQSGAIQDWVNEVKSQNISGQILWLSIDLLYHHHKNAIHHQHQKLHQELFSYKFHHKD